MISRIGSVERCAIRMGLLLLMGAAGCTATVSQEELLRRTTQAEPTWQNYSEDLKAQIGAGPVAEWEGHPTKVRREGPAVFVTFELGGPWAERDAAIPILVREPAGTTDRNTRAERNGHSVTYVFISPESTASAPPAWLEVKYPHGEKRLVLSKDGEWQAKPQ